MPFTVALLAMAALQFPKTNPVPAQQLLVDLDVLPDAVVRIERQATNALLVNPATGNLWLSVPPTASSNANQILEVDPELFKIVGQVDAGKNNIGDGNDPEGMAFSDDGSILYVGLKDAPGVKKIDAKAKQVLQTVALPDQDWPYCLQVRPGHPNSVAVTLGKRYATASQGSVVITDGVLLPKTLGTSQSYTLAFADADTLLTSDWTLAQPVLYRSKVDASGVTLLDEHRDLPLNSYMRFQVIGDRLYLNWGGVLNAKTLEGLGKFPARYPKSCAIDTANKRAFFIEDCPPNGQYVAVEAFDLETYKSLGKQKIRTAEVAEHPGSRNQTDLMRFGKTGLVFRTEKSVIFIDHAPGL